MPICDVCGKELSASALRRHVMTVHTGEVHKVCNICNKGFANVSNYHYHMAHHGNERNFVCSECPKAYKTKVDLLQHERVHANLKGRFECDKCLKQLNTKEKYIIHMKSHLPKGPQMCEMCNKTFVNLKMHIKTVHDNVRTYSCPHCEKSFAKKSGLDRHVTTVHEKLKNFPCFVCGRAFGEKAQLTKHIPIHANPANSLDQPDKKFKCQDCARSFAKKEWLKRHEDTVHKRLRNFYCDLCDKAYPLKYMLRKHVKATHLKIKVKRKKRLTQDPTVIENFMQEGLKSIMYSESSDDDGDATEQVFLDLNNSECDDKSKVKDDSDTFHSLLEAATAIDMIGQEELHEITSVFVKQEVKDTFENEVDIKMEPDDFDNISAPGSPGFHDYLNPPSPVAESLNTEQPIVESLKPASSVAESLNTEQPIVESLKPASSVNPKKSNLIISEVHTLSAPMKLTFNFTDVEKTKSNPVRIVIHPNVQLYFSQDGSVSQSKTKTNNSSNGVIKEFACEAPNCGKSYNFRNEREQHFHGCHPELSNPEERGKRTCSVCLKFFTKVQHMKAHVDAEHKKVILKCPNCPSTFKIKNSLTKHFKRHHEHNCPTCLQMFDTKEKLQTHWDIDHKDMPFPFLRVGEVDCNICKKILASQNSLARHKLEIHENVKVIRSRIRPCSICKEMFVGNYQKKKHMREIHKDGELLKRKCLLCNSEFELYDDFKKHVDAHIGVSICMTCGDHFPDTLARLTHINLVHRQNKYNTLNKNISCDICGHRVAIKAQMDHHMRKHSKQENFYICDVCGKSYKFLPPFLYHKQSHNKKMEFGCDYCDKKFRRKPEFIVHRRSHTGERPFKCEICGKGFAARIGLKTHQIVHSEDRKTFECKMCNIKFNNNVQRKSHIEQTHPELRTFYCKFCHRLFRYPHSLRMHIESKHADEDPEDAPPPPDHLLAARFHHNSQII